MGNNFQQGHNKLDIGLTGVYFATAQLAIIKLTLSRKCRYNCQVCLEI